jgi:hypothetical protein
MLGRAFSLSEWYILGGEDGDSGQPQNDREVQVVKADPITRKQLWCEAHSFCHNCFTDVGYRHSSEGPGVKEAASPVPGE